ncbi:hypothetical protein ACGFNU_41820 [Spirillospora sp. NPDC048911]|uniref:hypothetical protein n=1 Tax=Spirillospora sp. NPDC048911 TaxID=3364527 RepID=UPI0037103231
MAGEIILRALQGEFSTSEWAYWSSTLALDISQEFDALDSSGSTRGPIFYPAGEYPNLTPMEFSELRDQVSMLAFLAEDPVVKREVYEIAGSGYLRTMEALNGIGDSVHR